MVCVLPGRMIESVTKRRAFSGGSSGTYNVHALELAAAQRERRKLKGLNVTVRFLDDTEHVFHLEKRAKGAVLLEHVYQHLELVEKDYFGLQFSDTGCTPAGHRSSDWMRWLDPSKSLKKQLGNCQYPLHFRVKFYVSDPSKLLEEYTRYQFYLQLRKDILEERLVLPTSTAILLASYTVQSELGDYHPDEHGPGYLSRMQLIPGQTDDMERKICELHKLHKGQLPADAEFNFLDHAKRIEMYGVDLHRAKDNAGKEIQLGVTHLGLVVFQNNIRISVFSWSKIMKISFKRKQFFIQLRREASESYDTLLGFNMETYRSSKTLWKSCVEHHTFFRLHSPRVRRRFPLSLGSKFTYSGRTEFQTVAEVRQRGILERKFVRSPSKQLIKQPVSAPAVLEDKSKFLSTPARPPGPYAHKVTSLGTKEPKKAWTEDSRMSDDDGGFLDRTLEPPFSPGVASRVISYADEEPPSPTLNGGTESNVPIIVSRVAPNTPAEKCTPRLNEGDQLHQVNGQDVSHALHHDVVRLIQEARSKSSGKLFLTVKPTVLLQDTAEPEEQYDATIPGEALRRSMQTLAEGLASGALLARYETLYRKHPDMPCDEAMKPQNLAKNRYRDISPYDSTRVVLANAPGGNDYINANHVTMCEAGVTNRYIATQGPLPNTVDDFWQMVLEQECDLIVMLTTLTERGRPKCHKYWPDLGEEMALQNVLIKTDKEEIDETGGIHYREFILVDVQTCNHRLVRHLQYTSWPDHGVPDSPSAFLAFLSRVREARQQGNPDAPLVVHCSAGIGRTGVLVLAETAMCAIEKQKAVRPLEIVRQMRRQRAMMIQNASQYRFVCESVHAAYTEKTALEQQEDQEEVVEGT